MKQICQSALLISMLCITAGCSFIFGYTPDLQQGNFLDKESRAKVSVGMQRNMVVNRLGNPVLSSDLNHQQYSYVYLFKPERKAARLDKMIITFDKENKVIDIT